MEPADILTYLKENKGSLSKRQKIISDYLTENYDKAAYMTAAALSETVGVSESTVVRFAAEIGFSGYQEMQRCLRQITMTQSTSVKRMEIASRQLGTGSVCDAVLKSDIRMIEQTMEELDREQFDSAVDAVLKAENIYITGVRSAASLAAFADFYFRLMFSNTRLINSADPADMFEQVLHIGEKDVIIGMRLPRYSKIIIKDITQLSRNTIYNVEFLHFLDDNNCQIESMDGTDLTLYRKIFDRFNEKKEEKER